MTHSSIGLRAGAFTLTRPAELICFALCVAHLAFLAAAFAQGAWLIGPGGEALPADFVNIWSAGRQALAGDPAAAYDLALHKQAAIAAIGRDFAGHYPFIYPPTYLFVALVAALLPYVPAFVAFVALTFPLYAAAVRAIVGERAGWLLALAFPGILSNAMAGQNGFITAALIGGALLLIERRPVLAGCLLGLLSFKPHFGVLVPLVLIAGGHRRVFISAAVATALITAAAWLAFGTSAWIAFFQSLPVASQASLTQGLADWSKLQSLYGVTRMLGGGETLAWTLQLALAGALAVALCAIWRSRTIDADAKAAVLASGILLVTPYIFLYDLVALAIPMAFLIRAGIRTGFLPGEIPGLAAASALILVFPLVIAPLGFAAAVIVALLSLRRVLNA